MSDELTYSAYNSVSYSEFSRLQSKLNMVEAILCGLIKASSSGPLQQSNLDILFKKIDWKEAGLTEQEAHAWYEEHLLRDMQNWSSIHK